MSEANPLAQRTPLLARDLFFGNHRVTVDPVVGGSLEDASCDLLL